MPYVQRMYTHFQLIAYEVPTLTPVGPGAEYGAVDRIPVSATVQLDDARIRLRRLAGLVDQAERSSYIDRSPGTLKIFMAPEFYFRPNTGPSNSYSFTEMTEIMTALKTMFVHDDFTHWLIVPGTILSYLTTDLGGVVRGYLNTATMIKGGAEGPFHFVHKRMPSNIDGLPILNDAIFREHIQPLLVDTEEQKENMIHFDFRRFGIEVCLDHADHDTFRILKKSCKAFLDRRSYAPDIDLHLLTACGMTVNARSVAARAGGYILRVDGNPHMKIKSEIRKVTAQDYAGVTDATMETPVNTFFPGNEVINIPGLVLSTAAVGTVPVYPQELVYYGGLPLP